MALTATMFNLTVELSDVDRGVYETLDLKLAQHPSETIEYMVARLLAYCFEYTEGIELTQGVSAGDLPAILVRDLTGRIRAWIEVGLPDPDRLHRASKTADRVAVYTHRDPRLLVDLLEGKKIHRREELAIFALDRAFVAELAGSLDRRSELSLSKTEGHVYAGIAGKTLTCTLDPL
ncbi:MAG TPA: YaeQ family protein [Thermoanaerobaculia bacterium]|nr:YaeQ family protein [Thermoanaerobaculia bacterium]